MFNQQFDRRRFLKTAGVGALGLVGLSQSAGAAKGIGLPRATPDVAPVARVTVKDPSRVRLLQFTDTHFFCAKKNTERWKDPKTVEDMVRLVDALEPDLVAVTGDLWQENPHGQGEEYMQWSVEQCESLGVPWLFTWGNHDKLTDYARGHEALTTAKHALYRGGATGGNYTVQLANSDGEIVWRLLCLNTSDDGFEQPQRQWLQDELVSSKGAQTARRPAFALFHIPLRQYKTVWEKGIANGVFKERVAYDNDDGSTLAILKRLGVRACLCGHDHVNDYSGVLDGVDLIYGRATGLGGYGEVLLYKGAKLYTLNCEAATWTWETHLRDGTRWRPDPGERIEKA